MEDIYEGDVLWGYAESADSERWDGPFKTRAEAEDACRLDGGGVICEGRYISAAKVAADTLDMDYLLERMEEHDDVLGCFDDPIFTAKPLAEMALVKAVEAWAEEYIDCGYWRCTGEPIAVESK